VTEHELDATLRRMEQAERATRNPAPQSHRAFTAAADGKTVGTAPTEVYRGYQYRITEKGEAELKLSNGNWRTLPSIDELKAYVNALTGNLDRPGGVMFPTPAVPLDAVLPKGKGFEIARWRSRVSGQPEVGGLIPSSTMGEEMLAPGAGQVRAMILLMTNPVRSAANSSQLAEAFAQLEFLVAVDFYINETTRHAHIILPTPSPAEQPGYEAGFYALSVRNVAKWSWPVLPPPDGGPGRGNPVPGTRQDWPWE